MEVIDREWSENNTEVTRELKDKPFVLSIHKKRTKEKLQDLQGKSRLAMEFQWCRMQFYMLMAALVNFGIDHL